MKTEKTIMQKIAEYTEDIREENLRNAWDVIIAAAERAPIDPDDIPRVADHPGMVFPPRRQYSKEFIAANKAVNERIVNERHTVRARQFTEDEMDIILSRAATPEETGKAKSAQKIRINGQLFHVGGAILGGLDPSVTKLDPWQDAATFPAKVGELYFVKSSTGGYDVAKYCDDDCYHSTRALPSRIDDVAKVMEIPE